MDLEPVCLSPSHHLSTIRAFYLISSHPLLPLQFLHIAATVVFLKCKSNCTMHLLKKTTHGSPLLLEGTHSKVPAHLPSLVPLTPCSPCLLQIPSAHSSSWAVTSFACSPISQSLHVPYSPSRRPLALSLRVILYKDFHYHILYICELVCLMSARHKLHESNVFLFSSL